METVFQGLWPALLEHGGTVPNQETLREDHACTVKRMNLVLDMLGCAVNNA